MQRYSLRRHYLQCFQISVGVCDVDCIVGVGDQSMVDFDKRAESD